MQHPLQTFNIPLAAVVLAVTSFSSACTSGEPDPGVETSAPSPASEGTTAEDSPEGSDGVTELSHIPGGDGLVQTTRSFCTLLAESAWVGHLTVERIVSEMQDDPNGRITHKPVPVTTVSFDAASTFKGAKVPVVKMSGGVWPDGSLTPAMAEFTVGSEVLLFVDEPGDNGFTRVTPESVFYRTPQGGFSNGLIMGRDVYTASRIEQMVTAAQLGMCEDVLPDAVIDQSTATRDAGEPPHGVDAAQTGD